jgi:hypothetical protein
MTKLFKRVIIIGAVVAIAGCDKDFVDVNTNPYSAKDVDPALLFSGAQRSHLGTWAAEHSIVQQFVVPYNTGANLGFNFNEDIDGVSTPKWDQSYAGGGNGNLAPVKNLIHALSLLNAATTPRPNLVNMIRIWKAQIFMGLVDDYGDVPYTEAGKGYLEHLFFPKYDDDAAIYADLYKELKEATAALNPTGDYVAADLFYGVNGPASTKTSNLNTAAQVAKWKKLGYSLMLRLGMRYSRLDANKAKSIVAEAFAGGVMTSNADNAFVKYDGTVYTQGDNAALRNFSQFNYAAEPFVNLLKSTKDPRGKNILANFTDPGNVSSQPNPDTVLANQFGAPIGVTDAQISAGGPYRGKRGTGLNYSQMNVWTVASPAAPDFYVTYAQTSLLLAEAANRGWIGGGDAQAKIYYDNAIAADMATYALYPGTAPITAGEVAAYLADPAVAYDPLNALKLINTQYWIVNLRNGTEAFANFRRSTYPTLNPNLFNNKLNGGFARRLSYPDGEASANTANYNAAATAIGGDKLTSRVFWDIP